MLLEMTRRIFVTGDDIDEYDFLTLALIALEGGCKTKEINKLVIAAYPDNAYQERQYREKITQSLEKLIGIGILDVRFGVINQQQNDEWRFGAPRVGVKKILESCYGPSDIAKQIAFYLVVCSNVNGSALQTRDDEDLLKNRNVCRMAFSSIGRCYGKAKTSVKKTFRQLLNEELIVFWLVGKYKNARNIIVPVEYERIVDELVEKHYKGGDDNTKGKIIKIFDLVG